MNLTPDQIAATCAIVMESLSGQPMPSAAVADLAARLGQASAREREEMIEGFRQMFSSAEMLPAARLRQIEEKLRERGLPPLAQLIGGYDTEVEDRLSSALARGRIDNEQEWGAALDALKDMTSGLTTAQRIALGAMVNEFERRRGSA